nr:MAG TPA: hypothetical protein [Crassvirales sp.]
MIKGSTNSPVEDVMSIISYYFSSSSWFRTISRSINYTC